ncbi:MAG TPA: SPOR domain-containing protein [Steroidobacteraceae bacterium]|nr:SPOR domain-containing protein [Steroidobacteraceae bacterium]
MIDVTGGTSSIKNSAAIMSATDVFVINLCASMTPMPSVPKSLKGYENYRLYQVSRVEDGRHRYRLRLGFFNSEADAEMAVASLRSLYPAAFTSRAGAEDMRYNGDPLLTGRFEARPANSNNAAEVIQPKADIRPAESKPARPAAAASVQPVQKTAAAPVRPVAVKTQPAATAAPVSEAIGVTKPPAAMSLLDPPPAPAPAKERNTPFTMTTHRPFHVARGIDLPDTDLELEPTLIPVPKKQSHSESQTRSLPTNANKVSQAPAAKPKAAAPSLPIGKPRPAASVAAAPVVASKPSVATPVKPVMQPAVSPATTSHAAAPAAAKPGTSKATDDYVPILDTTMTIRTLSLKEMEDANQPKWFSVQLAASEQPFNLDAMPRLDIFAAYRLYSVAMHDDDGKLKHSLRLGFFKEEVSAEAVSGYLKTFFPMPAITRVSVAEYDRFIEPKIPEPPAEDKKVVKLEEKREQVQAVAPAKPTFGVNPAPAPARPKQAKTAQQKWNTEKPGYRPGPSGKYSIAAVKKGQSSSTSDSGIRRASAQRPQSFFSKLIGRELD